MTYAIVLSDHLKKDMEKLKRRDPFLFSKVWKKMNQIIERPEHYKPLGNVLKGCKRVHIGNSY